MMLMMMMFFYYFSFIASFDWVSSLDSFLMLASHCPRHHQAKPVIMCAFCNCYSINVVAVGGCSCWLYWCSCCCWWLAVAYQCFLSFSCLNTFCPSPFFCVCYHVFATSTTRLVSYIKFQKFNRIFCTKTYLNIIQYI